MTFPSFAFPCTRGTTDRTLPDRLAEVVDILDFGADPTGVSDSWAAITAAFNYGQVTLVATAVSSGSTMTFASVPASVDTAMFATNLTNPSSFAGGTNRVSTKTSTTVTLGFIPGTVQIGDVITFNYSQKRTVVIPPGTFLISQPVILSGSSFNIRGLGTASIITGNFSGFILKRQDSDSNDSASLSVVERLKIINTHASGGGIWYGNATLGAIRNCDVVANQGIQVASDRTPTPASGPLDMSVENCSVSPGANVSGSIGIMSLANGPISNCRIIGYESGMRVYGNEGYFNVLGCYFEGNVVGLDLGLSPDGTACQSGGIAVAGCWFKDNGTAIKLTAPGTGGGLFSGIRIEASELVTVGGGRPQYGIRLADGRYSTSLFAGILVTGQYDQYGIELGEDISESTTFAGVVSINTSTHGSAGQNWNLPATPNENTVIFLGCNVAPVITVAQLPASPKEGDCFDVNNSNTATWAATVAGGGSNHVKVRYNGTNWTVFGK